jgi:hypothetical protein
MIDHATEHQPHVVLDRYQRRPTARFCHNTRHPEWRRRSVHEQRTKQMTEQMTEQRQATAHILPA